MQSTTLPAAKLPFVEGGPAGHQQQWVKACKKGRGAYTSSPFEIAGPLTETVLMGNLAVRSYNYREPKADGQGFSYPGRKQLLWDGKACASPISTSPTSSSNATTARAGKKKGTGRL
jgi:hypothetical protein